MSRIMLAVLAFAAAAGTAKADDKVHQRDAGFQEQLLIVDRNTGRVVYDDGVDDLFCVTKRVFVGYNRNGYAMYRRTMRCR